MSEPRRVISKGEYDARINQGIPVGNCWVDMGNGERSYALHEVVVVGVSTNQYKDRTFMPVDFYVCLADNTRVNVKKDDFSYRNNAMKDIELEVRTIGDIKNSRITYSGNGTFRIDLDKLHNYSRKSILMASNISTNWKPGEIGTNTVVGQISFPQTIPNWPPSGLPRLSNTYDATKEGYNITERNTKAVTAQSTGRPDNRVRTHTITTGNVGSASTRGGAGLMIVLDVYFIAYGILTAYWVNNDLEGISKDQILLEKSTSIVKEALKRNLIPPQYQNQNDLGAIINFVFQGVNETGNKEITSIGILILKEAGMYDSKKIRNF